jgi:hypothetical protein
MDQMLTYDAILFPADGRPPHLVSLATSLDAVSTSDYYSGRVQPTRIPHPEVFMDYIAEIGSRAWQYHVSAWGTFSLSSMVDLCMRVIADTGFGRDDKKSAKPLRDFLSRRLT